MPSTDESDDLGGLTAITILGKSASGEAAEPSHLQLVVIGNGTFATHPLPDAAALTIGRSSTCDIAVDDESISRRHAILRMGETVTIEDLGSVNGTLVRGNRLKPNRATEIGVGELVEIGSTKVLLQKRTRPVAARRVWTHDYFKARLDEECAREARSGAAFALMRIQADRRASDAFVEETLADLLRDSDILGKCGLHEFEVLLPNTSVEDVDAAVRRIDARLVERGLKCRIFVACCPRDGRSAYQLTAKVEAPGAHKGVATSGSSVVVADAQMQGLYRLVEQVAGSNIGVLLLGETGVGKEVFARAVHQASSRATGPFVELNCAALTETLLESELFGHEKGSFTNAVSAKPGLLEMAEGGTLLLDEIGDMPLSTQVKLLRVIENCQLRRVGGLKARAIDVRFVAATNSDIEAQVEAGTFRRDLFFRLNGVTIVIPPLRERLAEIEPLARAFISHGRPPSAGPPPALSAGALDLLRSYSWPGNVRELKHVIERAVLLCGQGPINVEHLPAAKMRAMLMSERPTLESPPARREDLPPTPLRQRRRGSEEQQEIVQALERTGGNQTLAARLLGISRRTLVNRLNDYDQVQRPRKDKKKQPE